MKIAYFTPLNPIKSGISDFSEEILPYLARYVDVEVFIDNFVPENSDIKEKFIIHNLEEFEDDSVRNQYDFAIYQVGNNAKIHEKIVEKFLKYGGILELHDIAMHHYLAETTILKNNPEEYIKIMEYCHGTYGKEKAIAYLEGNIVAPWEKDSMVFTVCKHLIDKAKGVIVHSDLAKQMIKGINREIPIINIPLHTCDIEQNYIFEKEKSRQKLGITNKKFIIGSFGFAGRNKRIMSVIEALRRMNDKDDILYYIVGRVDDKEIIEMIKESNLEKYIKITGFVSLEMLITYMKSCDICINLRYPTQGESSAILHRMIGYGKPIILTDIGSYQEYPDSFTRKISYGETEIEELMDAIRYFRKSNLKIIGKKAIQFAEKNCSLEKNAKNYYELFENIELGKFKEKGVDKYLDILDELELIDTKYIRYFIRRYRNILE